MTSTSVTFPATRTQRAYAACKEVARKRARNFYYGLRLTPEPQRSAVFAIYAWMRTGDDLVDEAGDPQTKRDLLEAFTAQTKRTLAGEPAGIGSQGTAEMWTALADAVKRFAIAPSDLDAMLAGLGEDIEPVGYETLDDLKQYCNRVASSVGRVCMTIWGVREGASMERALAMADRRGLAFQLTNILRDFAQDFDEGRVYLPRAAFAESGLTPAALRRWQDAAKCERFVLNQAAIARREFDESAQLESMIEPACEPTLWAMTRIYSGLLKKIEDRPGRIVGDARIRLQSLHKAGIAMRAIVRRRQGER